LAKEIVGQKLGHLIDVLQYCVYFRTRRADILHLALYKAIPILKNYGENNNLTYNQLLTCSPNEILVRNLPQKKLIKGRQKEHTIIASEGKVKIVAGDKSRQIKSKFDKYFHKQSQTQIKGTAAFKGFIKGKIQLIYNINTYKKFKRGNILVTSMTTPDMLPIIKKASAIITDEGGITCHAAIISREFKIPCIIGTKVATKVFKNGDLVEVDTDNGVVRKI
jgi:phosphoenolpyruvate synthase/pyruvate phosphate dikinase